MLAVTITICVTVLCVVLGCMALFVWLKLKSQLVAQPTSDEALKARVSRLESEVATLKPEVNSLKLAAGFKLS